MPKPRARAESEVVEIICGILLKYFAFTLEKYIAVTSVTLKSVTLLALSVSDGFERNFGGQRWATAVNFVGKKREAGPRVPPVSLLRAANTALRPSIAKYKFQTILWHMVAQFSNKTLLLSCILSLAFF